MEHPTVTFLIHEETGVEIVEKVGIWKYGDTLVVIDGDVGDTTYLEDSDMDCGWGDSAGEDGDDSEESDWTGMIFFLTFF